MKFNYSIISNIANINIPNIYKRPHLFPIIGQLLQKIQNNALNKIP